MIHTKNPYDLLSHKRFATAKQFGYDFSILREAIEYNESIHRTI